MFEWAAQGAREGDWLVAERQTAGRGRMGRAWVTIPGNLYASSLIKLRDGDPAASSLALLAGCALYNPLIQVVAPYQHFLKWPNDVFVESAKIAGVLLERRDRHVVVGIGVNLAGSPEGLGRAVTSGFELNGRAVTPKDFMPQLASALADFLPRWRGGQHGGLLNIYQNWLSVAHPIGTRLNAALPDGSRFAGTFDGLTPEGALQLRLPDGSIRVIHAGDVFLI